MTPQDSSRRTEHGWEVGTAEQAGLLSDPAARTYFVPFLARARSVKAAAEEVGCRLDAMYYRVRRFVRAGLLRVVEVTPRAGRPIKLYRSVADAFYIPFRLTPYAEIEERIRRDVQAEDARLVVALARAVRASGLEGRRLYRAPDGEVMMEASGDPGPRDDWAATVRAWPDHRPVAERVSGELELTHAEARALLLAFGELAARYRAPEHDVDTRKPYLFQFAVVPWQAG